jgi:plasmid maintenance system antidote protein VapI
MKKKIRPMPEPFFKPTPGQHLGDAIELAEMTPAQLARRAGLPLARVRGILADEIVPVDDDAVAMSRVWGQSANMWRSLFGLPRVAMRKADQNIMLWTTAEKKEQIRAAAAAKHVSMSTFIRNAVDAALTQVKRTAVL